MLQKLLPILGLLLLGATVLQGALAQNAACTRDVGLNNSQGEDPCAVATKVGQICDPGFEIPSATTGQVYQGVLAGASTQCTCSSVYFTLLTVCGACEGADTVIWTTYCFNCTNKFVSNGDTSFPVTIPPGLNIPHWAFTPFLQNGSIDVASIQADKQPDVTGSSTTSSTTQSTSSTPSSPVQTTSPTPSQSQDSDNAGGGGGGGGTNAGAIAGGVVGGVVFLALLAALAFFLRRRLARNKGPKAVESGQPQMQTTTPSQGWTSPDTLQETSFYPDHSFGSRSPTPKLYNPDDPTTFPPAMSPSILRSTSPGQPTINSTFSAFPNTTPSEHGEWHPYRPSNASPEI